MKKIYLILISSIVVLFVFVVSVSEAHAMTITTYKKGFDTDLFVDVYYNSGGGNIKISSDPSPENITDSNIWRPYAPLDYSSESTFFTAWGSNTLKMGVSRVYDLTNGFLKTQFYATTTPISSFTNYDIVYGLSYFYDSVPNLITDLNNYVPSLILSELDFPLGPSYLAYSTNNVSPAQIITNGVSSSGYTRFTNARIIAKIKDFVSYSSDVIFDIVLEVKELGGDWYQFVGLYDNVLWSDMLDDYDSIPFQLSSPLNAVSDYGFDIYHNGINEGASASQERAYTEGFNNGLKESTDNAFNQGVQQGYDSGYSGGYTEGYNIGLDIGAASINNFLPQLIGAWSGTFAILNIELLPNLKLGYIIGFFLVIGVVSLIVSGFSSVSGGGRRKK